MSIEAVKIGNPYEVVVGGGNPYVLIAGPCVIEGEDHALMVAESIKEIANKHGVPYIFKSSFDKANRSRHDSYRGIGIGQGLEVLHEVKFRLEIPVTTDVHDSMQVIRAIGIDLIQIPAFLCRQTDLLKAAAETGRPVNVKKGQFMSPWDMFAVFEKLEGFGCGQILLTERGSSFGYNDLVVDFRTLRYMRGFAPIVFDATHSVSVREMTRGRYGDHRYQDDVMDLAKAAMAVGVDAIFVEVHNDPGKAKCDGARSLTFDQLDMLLGDLNRIHLATNPIPIDEEDRGVVAYGCTPDG